MVRSTVAGIGVIVRIATALVALLSSSAARGDMRELYTFLGYEAGAGHYLVPPGGVGSATTFAGVVDLTAYYGFTHSLHLGARIRLTSSSDVHFSGAKVTVPDGTQSTGDVWSDHRALGLGALALYRVDTGYAFAPALELEGGFTTHQYRNVMHVPTGAQFGETLSNSGETVFHGAATFLVEYRHGNRWIASAGVGIQGEPSGLAPWSVFVPFRFGRIWE